MNKYLSMLQILSHVIAVSLVALSPEEVPEKVEPIQEEGRILGLIGEIRSRKIVWELNFVSILAISHHRIALDTIHITITTATGTCFSDRLGVQFHEVVLYERSSTVMVTTFQKVVIDVGIQVVDHGLRDVVHIPIVTRSR